MYRHIIITLSAVISSAGIGSAQDSTAAAVSPLRTSDIGEVLVSVRKNNPELGSLQMETEAMVLQLKNENILEDPSIEYSSFYSGQVTGQASSELVVSQGFDFPTLYAARHKKNELSKASLESSLDNERRRILLDAKNLCLDIIMYRQIGELLDMQSEIAGELLRLYEQRLSAGDASALEVNKIRMELMGTATDVAANRAALDAATRSLTAMNGGIPVVFEAGTFPLMEDVADTETAVSGYLAGDAGIIAAENAAEAARKEISVSRQGWIPKLEIGYRRNTEIRDAVNGFLVGCSIPIFSNHKKVSMAKARSASAQSNLNYKRVTAETEVRSILVEMDQTKAALDAYDETLMRETLVLLRQAVEGGEISLIEYFTEASAIYGNLTACITLQNSWQKLAARLYRNRL